MTSSLFRHNTTAPARLACSAVNLLGYLDSAAILGSWRGNSQGTWDKATIHKNDNNIKLNNSCVYTKEF